MYFVSFKESQGCNNMIYRNASYKNYEDVTEQTFDTLRRTSSIGSIGTKINDNNDVDNNQNKKPDQIEVNGQTVQVLKNTVEENGEVYLIGTNHASAQSSQAVSQLLQDIKPQIVVIELCDGRAGLTGSKVFVGTRKFNFFFLYDAIKEIGLFPGMILLSMGYMERFISRMLKVDYGADMRAPATSKNMLLQYQIMLGDRPNAITLKRMASSLSFWNKLLMLLFVTSAIFLGFRCSLLKVPVMLMHNENFVNVLVHERDVFLTHSLQNAVERKFDGPTKIVGIVGLGHIPGILKLWGKVTQEDVRNIMTTD